MTKRFCFTIDVDWAPGSEKGLLGLYEFLDRMRIPATLFVAGKFAEVNPDLLRAGQHAGHALGSHGWLHCVDEAEDFRTCPVASRKEWLRQATEAIGAAVGTRPVLFRAPNLRTDEATLGLLIEAGYRLDSSVPARRYGGQIDFLKYFNAPLEPYHPSRTHLGRRGDSPVVEVVPSAFAGIPINMSGLRVFGFRCVAWATRCVRRRSPTLIFYVHPSEFVPASEQHISPNDPKRYREGLGPQNFELLEKYVRYALSLGYRPALMTEELAGGGAHAPAPEKPGSR